MNIYESSWIEVSKHATNELALARAKLENQSLSYDETQYIRGKIFALISILSLPDKKPLQKIEATEY